MTEGGAGIGVAAHLAAHREIAREDLLSLGAVFLPDGRCRFRVWAPNAQAVELLLIEDGDMERVEPMAIDEHGYAEIVLDGIPSGTRYMYRLEGTRDRPDPCSREQAEGVHGPSAVVDHRFDWTDHEFRAPSLAEAIFYEMHVGTFTEAGTFEAAIDDLDRLRSLGINFIEVMPVAAFPGNRNWGYDGVLPFAVQSSYGGPDGFRRFIDACHARDIGVALDVVYNHFGPEGNYLSDFGPYFTEKYHTPWGRALNFDGAHSDEVRRYFIENALSWVIDFHIDALRLDAVHAIFDQAAYPFLHELTDRVRDVVGRLGRAVHVIAESDLNDPRLIHPADRGGFAMAGQWTDDFHHALHAAVTGERGGYYADFGRVSHIAKSLQNGYVYDGQYSVHRRCRHGASAEYATDEQFVVCIQNHDQVGNRRDGDRLSAIVSLEPCKLAAGLMLLSPFTPLLFMGEEYGEIAPFLYFVSHTDPDLIEAVRAGRAKEFAAFAWQGDPPDPQDEATFARSRLDRSCRDTPEGRAMEAMYAALIRLRTELRKASLLSRNGQSVTADDESRTLRIARLTGQDGLMILANFSDQSRSMQLSPRVEDASSLRSWRRIFDSADAQWNGPGSRAATVVESGLGPAIDLTGPSLVVYRMES